MSQLIGYSIAQAFKIPRPPTAGSGTFSLDDLGHSFSRVLSIDACGQMSWGCPSHRALSDRPPNLGAPLMRRATLRAVAVRRSRRPKPFSVGPQ